MNIKELASQVWGDDSGKPWSDSALHHLEKFAELILEQERKEAAERYLKLIRDCVATEREACAKIVDENLFLLVAAAAIRARDMSTKPQNVNTSAEHVHEIDKSVHEPWDTSDMAHRPNGLTIDDDDIQEYKRPWVGLTDEEIENLDLPDKPTVKQFVWFIEAKLKEKNT